MEGRIGATGKGIWGPGLAVDTITNYAIAEFVGIVSRRIEIPAGKLCSQSRCFGLRWPEWIIVLRLSDDPNGLFEKLENAFQELGAS